MLPAFLTRWTTRFLSTPSARRATDGDISHYAVIEFLSTPSARRATSNNSFSIRFFLFLSTPSARRATIDQQAEIDSYLISIHALREEGDTYRWSTLKKPRYFYPRPPRGGRHHIQDAPAVSQQISIHALREEGDLLTPRGADVDRYFYPRPPRGGRQLSTSDMAQGRRFLSTPSARRATQVIHKSINIKIFLSTPSARRATLSSLNTGTGGADFYPRPPRGGRRERRNARRYPAVFLSTPSARRATAQA